MAINCFIKYADEFYRKVVRLNDNTNWIISIPSYNWNHCSSRAASYWVKKQNTGYKKYKFKYGTIQKEDEEIEDPTVFCCSCKKELGSRQYLIKHAKKCLPPNLINIRETDTVTNCSNQTVKLRDYGKENPRWFTQNLMYSVMGDIQTAIPKLVEKKHFNDNFPENKNLKLENRKHINKRFRIFEDGRWNSKDSKRTFYKVMIDIYDILCDALEKDQSQSQTEDDTFEVIMEGEVPEDIHMKNEIRKLHMTEKFTKKLQRIQPIWEKFRNNIDNKEIRIDMWEDLKTFLLDRQLAIEQGFE